VAKNHYYPIRWLTLATVLLAVVAAGGGLILQNLYRDSLLIKTAWFGNDLITLLLMPVLLAMIYNKRRDQRKHLIWLGIILYMFYNYAFYLFGAQFNWFFLVYAALFSLSLYSLILGLFSVNIKTILESFQDRTHRKLISIFLLGIAVPLGMVEISQCLRFIVSGDEPEIPTLILALDLSIVIPNSILSAILLWRNNVWGIVLSAMMLVKSFTYGLVLVVGTTLIGKTGIGPWDPLLPFYVFVMVGGLGFGWLLLKNFKPADLL